MKNETISKEYGKISANKTTIQKTEVNNCSSKLDMCVNDYGTKVIDLNIWGNALSLDQLVKWTTCRWYSLNIHPSTFSNPFDFSDYNPGNLLTMMKAKDQWYTQIKETEVCTSKEFTDILLPWCFGMHEALQLCRKYRGKMTITTSLELQKKLFSSLEGISDHVNCLKEDSFWTGFTDEQNEGYYVDVNEGYLMDTLMKYKPFALSQPNGEREENCADSTKNEQNEIIWYDTLCHRKDIPSFCRIYDNSRIQIRGESEHVY